MQITAGLEFLSRVFGRNDSAANTIHRSPLSKKKRAAVCGRPRSLT